MDAQAGTLEPLVARLRQGTVAGAVAVTSPATGMRSWHWGALPGGAQVTVETPMYAGSVSKQVVGVLAAHAVLAGALIPDDPVRRHLTGLPAWADDVQVQQLLHHTAGLPDGPAVARAAGLDGEEDLDNDTVLRVLERLPVLPGAGRRFAYSNVGYVVLAQVLHAACGQDVGRLARRTLFEPLRLRSARLGGPAAWSLPGQPPPPATVGDGGLWIGVGDLLRWLAALDRRRWGDAVAAMVEQPGRLRGGDTGYGWGVAKRTGATGTTFVHAGSWPGWAAMTVRQPDRLTAVAALAHTGDGQGLADAARALHRELSAETARP